MPRWFYHANDAVRTAGSAIGLTSDSNPARARLRDIACFWAHRGFRPGRTLPNQWLKQRPQPSKRSLTRASQESRAFEKAGQPSDSRGNRGTGRTIRPIRSLDRRCYQHYLSKFITARFKSRILLRLRPRHRWRSKYETHLCDL
jgi:hypothetical protein